MKYYLFILSNKILKCKVWDVLLCLQHAIQLSNLWHDYDTNAFSNYIKTFCLEIKQGGPFDFKRSVVFLTKSKCGQGISCVGFQSWFSFGDWSSASVNQRDPIIRPW